MSSGEALEHQKEYSENEENEEGSEENNLDTHYVRHRSDKLERLRQKAKERDGYQCVDCGITDEEHRERDDLFGEGLHVHHKIPVMAFGSNVEEAHYLENLITVCAEHHREREFS